MVKNFKPLRLRQEKSTKMYKKDVETTDTWDEDFMYLELLLTGQDRQDFSTEHIQP